MRFYQADPRLENYWRGVILFGKNVASYKFALAHALYDLKQPDNDLVTLEALAVPTAFMRPFAPCTKADHQQKQRVSRGLQAIQRRRNQQRTVECHYR